tara:strand:- start:1694 stop:2566 length:873 start_codon:yes stop_codon:yes gene_type:complete
VIFQKKIQFLCYFFILINLTSTHGQTISRREYIVKFAPLAVKQMQIHKIPASITIAQGILESNNGNSRLAIKGNNHFGIKCHGWEGKKIYADDDKKHECFRNYKNVIESYRDHSLFLKKYDRYSFLFDYKIKDYKSWAFGLKKAGYATNNKYPELLIKIIEENELFKYDKVSTDQLMASSRDIYLHSNKIKYVIANDLETYQIIAEELNLKLWQLYKYNDSKSNNRLAAGTKVFIQPKRNKCKKRIHVAKDNETLYEISQYYGLKLKKLQKRNLFFTENKLNRGDKIRLR